MARISPDGRWLAFLGALDGQPLDEIDLYIQAYPEGTPFRVTQTGVEVYAWEPGGDGTLSLLLTEGGAPAPGGEGKELRRVRLNESGGALQAPEFEDVGVSISTQGTFRTDAQGWELEVEDSPFAAGFGSAEAPVCAPIRGMLGALGDMLLGPGVVVHERACAATGAKACRFRVDRVETDNPG